VFLFASPRAIQVEALKLVKIVWKKIMSWEVLFVSLTTLVSMGLYFAAIPFLELVELKCWDLHFRQRGPVEPSGIVAFVGIDESSVNRDGRWPWPRRLMAQLLTAVEGYGATLVGLDLGFFEPDPKLRSQALVDLRARLENDRSSSEMNELLKQLDLLAVEEDDDRMVAAVIGKLSIPVVLGQFFYFERDSFAPPSPPAEFLDRIACPLVHLSGEPPDGALHDAVGLETNIPLVAAATPYAGSFNVFADPDGTVRRMPLVVRFENRLFPSLALQMLAVAFSDHPLVIKIDERGVRDVRLGAVSVPVNNYGDVLLNYYGSAYTFPYYSASALLHGEAPPGCLEGRLVVVGNTTVGLHDMRPTPFAPVFPGVELHCTVLENVLGQQFMSRSDRTAPLHDLAALVLLATLFLLIQGIFTHGLTLTLLVGALVAGYIGFTHFLFLDRGLWLNHLYPSANLMVAFLGTTAHRHIAAEREKRQIRQTLGRYVHSSVIEEMLDHPERLRLGGEKRELSVLFADIMGFTTLSERLAPEEIVPQLNEYLTCMTQVVFDHHGTLDKYIGDALMAFFGAPSSQPDHAWRACATALDMKATLQRLQQQWRTQGHPVLEVGIGINTGLMMVGNMGSEKLFDYTVLGDNVNLASRLEGITRSYGVDIIVADNTWNQSGDSFVVRELDVVRVKGRDQPVTIYHLLDIAERRNHYTQLLSLHDEALKLYRARRWDEARQVFSRILESRPHDRVARLYVERCEVVRRQAPTEHWTHVTTLRHK
jgi:adenylate cyclase